MTFLKTNRLRLRNVSPKDVTAMVDYRNNEKCSKYQRGQAKDHDGIAALVERRKNDTLNIEAPSMISVALKETDVMVGEIVVMLNNGTISLGYLPSKNSQVFGKWLRQDTLEEMKQAVQ